MKIVQPSGVPLDITGIKILILAGGTGGHVMPALAVAEYLQERNCEILWLGTRAGIEAKLVPARGFQISFIDISGLRGKSFTTWLSAPSRIFKAILASLRLIRKWQPDVVLSMGGYVAGPGAIAAKLLGYPIVLHEQNAIEGLTNRILAGFAKKIMVAFPNAFQRNEKKILTGNPVRKEIVALFDTPHPPFGHPLPQGERGKKINLLIIGGSQGATIFNEVIPQALALIPEEKRPRVFHQTGKNNLHKTQSSYSAQGVQGELAEFIDDMAKAYANADIVICRAGALTISELATVGVPSILVPFPFAVDDHQTYNAKYLSDANAAILLPQAAFSASMLASFLIDLIDNPTKREQMALNCKQLAKPMATEMVAKYCLEESRG